jgi:5-methylcytosine-specific restriction endonuclease McrA
MRQRSAPTIAGRNNLLDNYRRGAKKRNLDWALTVDQFTYITSSNCYYCDAPPHRIRYNYGGIKAELIANSAYTYNGIDRIDPKLGYTLENCRACCWTCNKWKGKMSSDDFFSHINKISIQLRLKKIL